MLAVQVNTLRSLVSSKDGRNVADDVTFPFPYYIMLTTYAFDIDTIQDIRLFNDVSIRAVA